MIIKAIFNPIKNSNTLFKALSEYGFKMVSRRNELPISHMISIKGDFPDGNHHACAALQECNISTNSKRIFSVDTLRLGVQEITRRGMKEEEMKQIASFFKEIVLNGNMGIAKTVQEFNKEFNRVEYSFDDHMTFLK